MPKLNSIGHLLSQKLETISVDSLNPLILQLIKEKEEALAASEYWKFKAGEFEEQLHRELIQKQILLDEAKELRLKYQSALGLTNKFNQLKAENSTLKQSNSELEECAANLRNTISQLSQKCQHH